MTKLRMNVTLAVLLSCAVPLLAAERRTVHAVRASAPVVVDGDLSDAAWQSAPEITGLTQHDPDDGQPASQNTVIKIVYDDSAIYFAARLDDTNPVSTLLTRRDNGLTGSDFVEFSIDSQHDRLNGASFVVNPSNVQVDMILYNDIYDDWSWDAVWESAAKIIKGGWVAEVRIPYSQLRFPDRDVHTWGFNVRRRIATRQETAYLVNTPKGENGTVSRFADLDGISGIHPRRAFEVSPYAVARTDLRSRLAPEEPFLQPATQQMDGGVDVKYGLTSNLTLTGTINPDFGQVEVDPAVLNLSDFETFFPEKRPFFTEGKQIFNFGNGPSRSRWGFNSWFPNYFYSRRIGRSPQGSIDADYWDAPGETTILGAAKITGKVGKDWTVGVLDALTDREVAWFRRGSLTGKQLVEPMTNYLVARSTKEYGKDSRIGFIFTSVNRRLDENLAVSLRESAYAGGVDGYTSFKDKSWLLEWQGGGTLVEGSSEAIAATQESSARYYQRPDAKNVTYDPERTSLGGYGGRIMLNKQTGVWKPNIQIAAYSPGFELNDVGFMPRPDIIASHAVINYLKQTVGKYTRERGFWIGKYQNWNFDHDLTANGVAANGYIDWKNYMSSWAWFGGQGDRIDDRRTRGGPLMERQPYSYWGAGSSTDTRKKFSGEVWFEIGEDADGGYARTYASSLVYRPSPALKLSVNPQFSRSVEMTQYVATAIDPAVTHTYGSRYVFATLDQKTLDFGIRAEWTASSRLSFQLYMQPFVASGSYYDYKELARPRSDRYVPYNELQFDSAANAYRTPAVTIDNPDFNFRSVRGSAVVRWEFRPGSAMYVVWNENRADSVTNGDFRLRRDLSALPDAPSQDVFLIKFSYWLPM